MEITYKENGIEIILLNDIINKCNETKVNNQDLAILKIEWDGRGFNVTEQRLLPKKIIGVVVDLLIDKEVYFGEIAGKHSEVYGKVERSDIEIIEDKEKVTNFLKQNPSGSEYNHSFIDTLIEWYEDNGGREWGETEYDEDYCDNVEELDRIVNKK